MTNVAATPAKSDVVPASPAFGSATTSSTSPEHRVAALDGVRGIAILLVIVDNLYIESSDTVPGIVTRLFFHSGWVGVDLFFVLSGYLISSILLDTRGQHGYFRSFYVRRTLRIFPLYYATLAFLFFVVPHLGIARPGEVAQLRRDGAYYWFYAVNYLWPQRHVVLNTAHFWSLALEEQFYWVWPAIVLLLGPKRMVRFAVALLILGVVLRYSWYAADLNLRWLKATPFRLDGFAVGALLALGVRSPGGLARWRKVLLWAGLIAAPISAGLMMWGMFRKSGVIATWIVGYTTIAITFGAFIGAALLLPRSTWLSRLLHSQWLRRWGIYSYAIYILHPLVMLALHRWFPFTDGSWQLAGSEVAAAFAFMIAAAAISYGMAYASWRLFESKILSLKRFFPYARTVRAAPADSPAN